MSAPGIKFYGVEDVYSETGVDLTLLRENLKRTVEQRLEGNARALRLIAGFHQANSNARTDGRSNVLLNEKALIAALVNQPVEFVLIGGLAMRALGSAHVTDDLDVCYNRTPENAVALAAALAPFHPYLRGAPRGLPFRFDAPAILAELNFTLTTDLGDVDVLGEVAGVGNYEQVFAQSQEQLFYEMPVRVLSVSGLIAAKKAAGRVKDRLHLLELEELKKLRDAAQGGN